MFRKTVVLFLLLLLLLIKPYPVRANVDQHTATSSGVKAYSHRSSQEIYFMTLFITTGICALGGAFYLLTRMKSS
jgi:hypothetical protein